MWYKRHAFASEGQKIDSGAGVHEVRCRRREDITERTGARVTTKGEHASAHQGELANPDAMRGDGGGCVGVAVASCRRSWLQRISAIRILYPRRHRTPALPQLSTIGSR